MSGSGMTLGRILTNMGGSSLEGAGSSLTLLAGAVWNSVGTFGIIYAQGIFGTGTLNILHDGSFIEVGSAAIQATFNNSGSASVNDGTLTLNGGGTQSGSFAVPTVQGALEFAGGTFDFQSTSSISTPNVVFSGGTAGINGTYNVTGSSTFSGATVTFNSGTTVGNLGAAVTVSGGSVTFNAGQAITLTALLLSGGTLNGSDNLTVSGLFTWWGGTMSGTGTTTANGGITIDGSGMTLARPLTNTGTALWTGPGDIAATADAVFNNPLNAVFDIQNNQTFSGPSCIPVFNNAGIFRKEASYGITAIGLFFNNTGTVDIQTGTVNFSCGMLPPRPPDSPCHCRRHGSAQADAPAQALNTSIVISEILRAHASTGRLGADATGVIQTQQPNVLPDWFFALQGTEHGQTASVEPRHFFPAARGKIVAEMTDLLQGLFFREPGKEGDNQDILVGMD
jgi:fibronectin-binding autotransporter adhesin